MSYDRFRRPAEGRVWFDGGPKVAAKVLGEWNGFAVAEVRSADLKRLFGPDLVRTETRPGAAATRLVLAGDPEGRECGLRRGWVSLGDGWSLNWEPAE